MVAKGILLLTVLLLLLPVPVMGASYASLGIFFKAYQTSTVVSSSVQIPWEAMRRIVEGETGIRIEDVRVVDNTIPDVFVELGVTNLDGGKKEVEVPYLLKSVLTGEVLDSGVERFTVGSTMLSTLQATTSYVGDVVFAVEVRDDTTVRRSGVVFTTEASLLSRLLPTGVLDFDVLGSLKGFLGFGQQEPDLTGEIPQRTVMPEELSVLDLENLTKEPERNVTVNVTVEVNDTGDKYSLTQIGKGTGEEGVLDGLMKTLEEYKKKVEDSAEEVTNRITVNQSYKDVVMGEMNESGIFEQYRESAKVVD
jgi:hypothetical protein